MARAAACPAEPAGNFSINMNEENEQMEILVDYEKRETVTLKELMPKWWGKERYEQAKQA